MSAVRSVRCLFLLFLPLAHLSAQSAATPARADAEPAEITALRAKAEKGNGVAQFNLGLAYAQGRLVPVDLPEAFVWLSLAAENGTAGQSLQGTLSKLTDEQLAEGQQRLIARRAMLAELQSKSAGANRAGGSKKPNTLGFSLSVPTAPASTPDSTAKSPPEPARNASPPPVAVADTPPPPNDPSHSQQDLIALRNDRQQLATELARTKKALEQARADLQAANTELAALRAGAARPAPDAKSKP